MKLVYFSIACLLILSCNKEDSGCYDYKEPNVSKTEEPFARAQTMRYFFKNEAGEDLLNPLNENAIRPLFFVEKSDEYLFFPDSNQVEIRIIDGKYYWSTSIYGKKGYHDYQFYVQINETDIDTIRARFRYSEGAVGGNGIYANIEKLYYNETLIRSHENSSCEFVPQDIYITKLDEKTVVGFD